MSCGRGPGPCEDTYYGAGKGRLFDAKKINKLTGSDGCGAVAYWTFTDGDVYNSKSIKNAGEPGKRDRIVSLAIYDNTGALMVRWDGQIWGTAQSTSIATNALKFPGYFLNTGNHQFLPASFPNAIVKACQNQDLGAAVPTLQPTDFQAQKHIVGQADKPFP